MLGGRHSLRCTIVCRRPQAGTNLKLRDLAPSGCLPLFHVPRLTPYWATLGRRSSTSYRTWEEHGWCPMVCGGLYLCACVRVCGMYPNQTRVTRGDFPAATSRGESERSSCTAKEHSNLQYNGMQWDIVDHRCFIIYLFTIIGRGFCPFASV